MYDKNGREIDLGVDDAGRKLQVQHLPSDYRETCPQGCGSKIWHVDVDCPVAIADQEQRWGEEPVSVSE